MNPSRRGMSRFTIQIYQERERETERETETGRETERKRERES